MPVPAGIVADQKGTTPAVIRPTDQPLLATAAVIKKPRVETVAVVVSREPTTTLCPIGRKRTVVIDTSPTPVVTADRLSLNPFFCLGNSLFVFEMTTGQGIPRKRVRNLKRSVLVC